MKSLNKHQIIGYACQDAKYKEFEKGAVCNFSIATNRSWKDANGDLKTEADFHRISVWGKLAEIARDSVKKGSHLYVSGRVQTSSWEDTENNITRYSTETVLDELILLDPKEDERTS